jgi:hypothetical protein
VATVVISRRQLQTERALTQTSPSPEASLTSCRDRHG